jgi:hypothetical protein
MKRVMMILATAALASALAVGAADARGSGGGGGGHGGGFGGGGHMGGFGGGGAHIGGGAHFGGLDGGAHVGGFGEGVHVGGMAMRGDMGRIGGDHLGLGDHPHPYGTGIHYHAMNHYGRYRPGYAYSYGDPGCYDWYALHPDRPLPLSCS